MLCTWPDIALQLIW